MDGEKEQTKTKKQGHKQNLPLGKHCVDRRLTHYWARESIWGNRKVMKALKHGQRMTRVMSNEKKCTINLELTLFAALIIYALLAGWYIGELGQA